MSNKELILENRFSKKQQAKNLHWQEKPLDSKDLLLHYTEESFVVVDADLKIVNFNNKFKEKYTYYLGKEIIKGQNILNYAPPKRIEIARNIYQQVLKGETLEVEVAIPAPDNTFYSTLNKYKPVYDNHKHIIGVFVSCFDVTPTRKAQLETRQSEDKYRAIVENSIDAFFFSNYDGSVIDVNGAAVEIFGYSLEEFKQLNRTHIIDHSDNRFINHLAEREKTGKMKGEAIGIRKNGEHFPIEFSSIFYTDINNAIKVGTFISDISARKNAEKKVELNERRFRALVENATDIIILSDIEGIIQYVSPAFERITGFSLDEVLSDQNLVKSRIHPEYLAEVKKTLTESLNRPNVPLSILMQFQHKNGNYIWLEGVITNQLNDENVSAIVSNYRDVSRRKTAEAKAVKSEKRFQALVENLADIIVLSNSEGYIQYVSPAFEKLTGYHPSEVIGKRNMIFMHPQQAEETVEITKRLLETPGLSIPRLNRIVHKNGSFIWVEGCVTNLLHDENVNAIVSNYHDITERLQAAEELKQSETNLKTIFENTSEAFLLIDRHGKVKAFNSNARAFAFLNTANEIAIGKDVLNFIEDDRKEAIVTLFEKVFSGESIQFDRLYEKENGKVWIDFSIRPVEEEGKVTGICVTGRDVTARKLAVEELRKRELRFRSILENSHDMLFLFDIEGKIEFLSPAIEKAFGYTNGEDEIHNILDSIHPDDLEHTITQLKHVFQIPELPVSITFRKKNKDGKYIWLEGTLTNMLHVPDIKVIVANFKDVTERKRFEEEQAMFVSIVNSSEDAIFSQALDNKIVTWNKGAAKLFGYTSEEAIGNNCSIIIPSNRLHEEEEIFDKINQGISVEHFETQRRKKTGELIYISLTVSPIRDSKGNITGASKIARDVSDKKKAEDAIRNNEKRFRSLLQNSNDGLSLMSIDGVMLEISPAGKRITGYDDNEMIGQARYDLIHPDDLENVSQAFIDVIEDPSKTKNFQYRSLSKDGTYKWLEACCQNLLHEPTVGAIVINYRDITERKNQEMEREQLIKTLHQNNNDLRNFSYITSHNLKAPLSNLMGFIDLLEDMPIKDPTLKTMIDGFKASTIQLNNTVNDLVKILIIRDSDSIEQKEIFFGQIFTQVKGQLKNLIEEVAPEIKVNFSEAPTIIFNETYLESIFMNLLTNSIKYRSYDRKLKINIEAHKEKDGIIMTFSDNGIGFDVERHKSKVFGLYQRFHDRPNSKGLGLYLIKSQMESLGGSIDVDSTVDVGTTFTLRFALTSKSEHV
ncbi:PAS domain S-box protein [Emticicia sp. C21]|uniref:PAS domain-containing protein n=1 Tax=Emticicia sp. C21 TaxID=2302915 RepID=UPI000E34666F|nr:PAS domain S-box protein [Emticicia sp. C21]RFS17706.1 PAS domain S-box protein [Emticicia sp. C21]